MENRLQSECYVWFHNSFPELRGLLCYNLNNSRSKVDGMMNKAMGLQKHRSDLVLYYQGRATMIEMKTATGVHRAGQKNWQRLVEAQGFEYYLIRSLPEFQQLIERLINAK